MLPIPSRTASIAFSGCIVALLVALAGRSPLALTLAGGGVLGLAWVLALSTGAAATLRRERLSFRWSLAHGGVLVTGGAFELRCVLYNPSARAVALDLFAPVLPDSIVALGPSPIGVEVAPKSRAEFAVRLRARACGRVVLPGVAAAAPGPLGLFSAPLYFPSALTFDVLPRAALRRPATAWPRQGVGGEPAGPMPLRRPGGGSELREIREHRAGDPFKSIAWKASARAGRLMVREMEHEVQETHVVVLDVSGTMRGEAPGARKLDRGIELAALATREALDRGDRAGLVTVDGRILTHVAPRAGLGHALAIYDALLATTHVVDADLTDVGEAELVALVARHLRRQEGLELERDGRADRDAIDAHVAHTLPTKAATAILDVPDARERRLRAYCREHGIPLRYRAHTRDLAKAAGLARALREAAGRSQSPRTILLVSDLEDVARLDALAPTLAMLHARRHGVVLVLLRAPRALPTDADRLARDLHAREVEAEQRRLRVARELFTQHGASLVICEPADSEPLVLRRARAAAARRERRVA